MNTPVASVPFIDGISRPAFLDAGGRQYILDEEGQPVYGVWVYIPKCGEGPDAGFDAGINCGHAARCASARRKTKIIKKGWRVRFVLELFSIAGRIPFRQVSRTCRSSQTGRRRHLPW